MLLMDFLKDRRPVRRFLGALTLFSLAGTTLWAIVSLPYFQNRAPEAIRPRPALPAGMRTGVPLEMAWFFARYPYLSMDAQIRVKNHHKFLVTDSARGREYIVLLGQQFRRIEIYFADDKARIDVQILQPGSKRTVLFRGPAVVSDTTHPEHNAWMWQNPIWNPLHVKIYTLADAWLDAPYKRYACAGFVRQFLQQAGVDVPLLNAWDFTRQPWTRVSYKEMEPGDIVLIRAGSEQQRVFWKHRVTHVAIYLGRGKIIHAATTPSSRRAWVRVTGLDTFRRRIDRVLRPPDLL